MTKRDLAARLGTVPETLSRAFAGLKRARVIRLSSNGELVEVLDFDALARIAQY
jgi:DNA-binding transcriptional regulator YhcF (GntR family)